MVIIDNLVVNKQEVIVNPYVLLTDSACDIPNATLRDWGVAVVQMSFTFDGDPRNYLNCDMEAPIFYGRMRHSEIAHTSAINFETFRDIFTPYLRQGQDICYLAFSSGLSSTCQSAAMAARELMAEYPDRRIYVVDTLSASAGFGLLVYLASLQRNNGVTLDQLVSYAEAQKLHLCHWFTVDHLTYLKRGGRVSPTAAAVGQFLQIKPVLHVDDEGHLIPASKARGRRASIIAMAEQYGQTSLQKDSVIFIGHGDCRDDAEYLAQLLRTEHGATGEIRLFEIGAVIGAHSGPGTLALFFLGDHR